MGRNLSNLYISSSFQFLTQISGSELQNGLGDKITGSLDITASLANTATSASQAVSASYSNTSTSASYAAVATSSSYAINASNAVSASYVASVVSASYAANATSASYATTASYALNAGAAVNTGSLLVTASAVSNTITFTKGDGSTFPVTVATGSGGGGTVNTGSLLVTASISNATTTYTKGDGSTFALTVNNVVNATSASLAVSASTVYAQNTSANQTHYVAFTDANNSYQQLQVDNNLTYNPNTNLMNVTASFANSASQAVSSSRAVSASIATSASQATSSSFAVSASQAVSSSFAVSASQAVSSSFATTASFALNATVNTGSLLVTASAANNVITFTKGDGSTFPVTVATGSAGAAFPYTGSAEISGSLKVSSPVPNGGLVILGNGSIGFSQNTVGNSALGVGVGNTVGNLGFVSGERNNTGISSYVNTILGGTDNTISTNNDGYSLIAASYQAILGNTSLGGGNNYHAFAVGTNTVVVNGYAAGALGAKNSNVYGFQALAAATINSNVTGSNVAVIASSGSSLSGSRSAIIGGTGIVGTADDTVYVPNLIITGSNISISGSNVIANWTDTYTSSPKVNQVVTLTQAEYNAIGSPNANTLYIISGSLANATVGSNTFTGNQVFSGSVRGVVISGSTTSNTASLDFSAGNFFTLNTNNVLNTQITPTNIQPGQTVNLELTFPNTASIITFPSFVKQPSGSNYIPSGANTTDILTFIVFNTGSVYLSSVKNLI